MSWTNEPPTTHDAYFWNRQPGQAPVLMRTVLSAPGPDGQRLLAGPWAGGLTEVSKIGGHWLHEPGPNMARLP